jgi:glutathionylspermidine synthase
MKRTPVNCRPDWKAKVEEQGLTFHTLAGAPYWNESACYCLTAREVDELEDAANELHRLCLEAAGRVIQQGLWDRLGIPPAAVPVIRASWERNEFTLYGRFDLAYDPNRGPPKLLEYNADTPTALLEASVIQWHWMQEQFPGADQFNSLHERLVDAWKGFAASAPPCVHFAGVQNHLEDAQTVLYLQDTCHQAGFATRSLFVEEIGWDARRQVFAGMEAEEIQALFKLYPWEWLWREEFGPYLALDKVRMIEPAWKMLLSNKGLLPILWEMFPRHPNLLPTYFADERPADLQRYVQKPILSREGANITVVEYGSVLEQTGGDYGAEGFVVQETYPLPRLNGFRPVMGVWVINHQAGGLGIREDAGLITGNLSMFTPHYFLP